MMGPQSVFRFGKYRGLSVEAIAKFNPEYLAWAEANLDSVSFDDAALAAIKPALRLERDQSMQRQNGWAYGFGAQVKVAASDWRSRAIKIEHAERRKAGQQTCPQCWPHDYDSCPKCNGTGWIVATCAHPTNTTSGSKDNG